MAASSIGSDIFALSSLALISVLALLVIRHYVPLRSTPGYLLLPVFLALALPCSIILLVPIDLASAVGEDGAGKAIWLPKRVTFVTWRITYWLTFVLTWFILPFLGEYCDGGYRETRARVIYSLRSNARYQLIVLVCGILGLVYFILQNGFDGQSIKGVVMALAYTWGLILAIGLMGHGMVALPRRLYVNASVSRRLKRLQAKAPKIKDKLDDGGDELDGLENAVSQLKQRKHGTSRDLQDWIDELAETSLPETRPGGRAGAITTPTIPAVLTERYLADMTRKLKRARHKKIRFAHEWALLCQQAQDTQSILDSASTRKLDFGRAPPGWGRIKLLTPAARYHLYANVLPVVRVTGAGFLAIASVLLLWSECVKGFKRGNLSIIGLTVVHNNDVNVGGQLIAGLWLLYMCTCALYAVSDVKVWGNRALVVRNTYSESATWYSLQVAKLTVPLSYNFITMLPDEIHQETMFYKFLGNLINLTPLGSGFSTYFPCFILLPVLASAFNLYGRANKLFGFGDVLEDETDEDSSSPFSSGGWREGRTLIEQEWQRQNRDGGNANLGLASRGPSLDLERNVRAGASVSGTSSPMPRREQQQPLLSSNTAPTAVANNNDNIQTARMQFNSITNQEEQDDDDGPRHFYQDFTERVKNTFDTADRPEWVRDLGNVFKTPKWMQNDDEAGPSGGRSDNNPFKKWFGGSDGVGEGRVRL